MIPVNRKYPIHSIITAARARPEDGTAHQLRVCAPGGVNESDEQARRLAAVVGKQLSYINLIPMNPIEGSPLAPPSRARADAFQRLLLHAGISTTICATRGLDIDAACGQLRAHRLTRAPHVVTTRRSARFLISTVGPIYHWHTA